MNKVVKKKLAVECGNSSKKKYYSFQSLDILNFLINLFIKCEF